MSFSVWNTKPPFELTPEDPEQIYQVGDKWVVTDDPARATQAEVEKYFPPPAASAQEVALSNFVQATLDQQARALGYDSVFTACTYAEEPAVPKFQTEGRALRAWRSQVWAACYQILADVQAGNRVAPTEAELLAELPALAL